MTETINTSHTISSPIELLKVIQQADHKDHYQLFYLGFSNPNDVENCGNQTIDITRNPLIALFFACVDLSPNNGEVLIYQIPEDKISHALMHNSDDILTLTERGTFVFINHQQNNASLLAKDQKTQTPLEIIVNKDAKQSILQELDKLGISIATLYPEMT